MAIAIGVNFCLDTLQSLHFALMLSKSQMPTIRGERSKDTGLEIYF
ncbi:hypothetical protein FDUTEX481_04246 [Tolypothrix sp. PCC 7601]|nr:hypothetical protein FDUTEX481_04246 [Tolypothrix sp. PCC 7601]